MSRVPQPLLEAVCQQPSLEALYVKWSGISDLASLPRLRSLQHLYLGSSGSVTDIAPLGELASLIDLYVESFQKVSDYQALGRLSNLRDLAIEGDAFGPRRITIASLAFVARLEHLECLRVQVARLVDPSLQPLLKLARLRHLDLPSPRDPEVLATLRAALPGLESGNVLDPAVAPASA